MAHHTPSDDRMVEIVGDRALAAQPDGPEVVLRPGSAEAQALQAFMDASLGYLMLVDEHHRIVMVNHTMASVMQTPAHELCGALCHERVHGIDCAFGGCPLEEARDQGHGVERHLHDLANDRHLTAWVQPTRLRTPAGDAIFLHGATDITAEVEAAREADRQLRTSATLAELLELSTWQGDLETLALEALRVILSLPWLEIEERGAVFLAEDDGRSLRMLAQVNLAESLLRTCAEVERGHCLCGRALATAQLQYASEVDDRHDVHYPGMVPHGHYCVPITCNGEVLGVLTLYLEPGRQRDAQEEALLQAVADGLGGVLQRKLDERRLAESEARFRSLAEAAPNAILLLDATGRVVFSNHKAQRIFGRDHAGLAALPDVTALFAAHARAGILALLAQPRTEDGQPSHLEGRRADGAAFPVAVSSAPVPLAIQGHRVLVLRDTTLERELQAAIVRSERLATTGTLAAGVVHELNTPLTTLNFDLSALGDCIDELESQLTAPGTGGEPRPIELLAELRGLAADLRQGTDHLARVIASMRSLSRVTEERRIPLSMEEIAQQATTLLRPQLNEVQVELVLQPAPRVRGNAGQLVQVVLNLLLNAMRAAKEQDQEPPKVTLTCRPAGAHVLLEVRDNGPGVPESIRTQLFEPFATTRSGVGGTGLGLWISADIVRAHDGSIEHVPVTGPGALFRVRLPALEGQR